MATKTKPVNGLENLNVQPITSGTELIQGLHDKKAEINSELHHDRNLKLQTFGITTAFWFAIVGTFLLGTRF